MEILIKIDEGDYEEICKCSYPNDVLVGELIYQVRNNKPLPKGHGRLIDADALIKTYDGFVGYDEEIQSIKDAPTIIEADKE